MFANGVESLRICRSCRTACELRQQELLLGSSHGSLPWRITKQCNTHGEKNNVSNSDDRVCRTFGARHWRVRRSSPMGVRNGRMWSRRIWKPIWWLLSTVVRLRWLQP